MKNKIMKGKLVRWRFLAIFISSTLVACNSQSVRDVAIEDKQIRQERAALNSLAIKADTYYSRGEYSEAAALYKKLAGRSESTSLSQDYLLRTADSHARAGENKSARAGLKKLNTADFNKEQRLLYKIVQAQIDINEARARDAFGLLPRDAAGMSLDTQVRLGMVRADAWLGLKRNIDAVMERIDVDPFITISEERTLNHQWIWNQLQKMPRQDIFSPPSGMTQDDAGWWSLAAIVKKGNYQGSEVATAGSRSELDVWKETYPGHPATEDILFFIESDPSTPDSKNGMYTGTVLEGTPRNVALLLPLSGHYANAGQSVLSGFRSAANNSYAANVNYKVYDSADVSHTLSDIVNQAVVDGAEMIIGPLQKSVLSSLIATANVGVPILALNTLPDGTVGMEGLFQFGLSPENEAAEVARRAIVDGHYRAVVLASEDAIGERIANAFMAALEQEGGQVVAYDSFEPKSNTISQVMKNLLRAGSSDPLWEDVRKGTQRQSNNQQQIDMIFFTASPRDSRIVRPIVQLHRAFDLPVYTTARVYNQPDLAMDKDLEGLVFCDMPSRLSGDLSQRRLSALGTDAYLLVNELHGLTSSPGTEVPGKTGRLSARSSGQIWRHLDCAVFKKGEPKLLP